MKSNKSHKKLKLNKETVSKLDSIKIAMQDIRGGIFQTYTELGEDCCMGTFTDCYFETCNNCPPKTETCVRCTWTNDVRCIKTERCP